VTHQVDRSAEQLQLGRQPVSIGRRRRVEAVGRGDAEPGRGQDDRVGPIELPDPEAMAVFLVGLVRGIALQLISTPPPARVKAIIDEAERSTLRALRP
jgi:hypothetical protein